jgi:cbb3-type cytochrome c oxidase subunit III
VAEEHKEVDALTGTATTGHEWDGLRELNTPLPRWWLWLFYITIVWSVGYWIVYPAWPLLTNSTQGVFGYHTRTALLEDLDALKPLRTIVRRVMARAVAAPRATPISTTMNGCGAASFRISSKRYDSAHVPATTKAAPAPCLLSAVTTS